MAWILKRMLENPHLPEQWRHTESWPEAMRKEWSTDEGAAAARVHREERSGETRCKKPAHKSTHFVPIS